MAKLHVKYQLVQSNGPGIVELIQIDSCVAKLQTDQQVDDPQTFENAQPFTIITFNGYFIVRILASSNEVNYRWKLTIWLTNENGNKTKKITDPPIVRMVDASGRADYNGQVIWDSSSIPVEGIEGLTT